LQSNRDLPPRPPAGGLGARPIIIE